MTVDDFRERIIRLSPNNLMGLNGAGPGIAGATTSTSDALLQLQRAALEFVRLYKTGDNEMYLQASRKEVLAKIMVAHTVDAVSEQQADELIADLQQLMKERE